jgi:hypothetical protein
MGLLDTAEKFKRIAEGWKNVVFTSPTVEVIAKGRAKVCAACPHAVPSSWLQAVVGDEVKEIQGLKCELCNCPISAKVRSLNEKCAMQPDPLW